MIFLVKSMGIVGIVKKNKIKKNTLLLTPHASEKWIRRKTPFYILIVFPAMI
jgi:hypothetical protein